jgi:hypothetical protein
MNEFIRKYLEWWNNLVFQNEFADIPMKFFEPDPAADECWTIHETKNEVTVSSLRLERRAIFSSGGCPVSDTVALALSQATSAWGPDLALEGAWRHIDVYCWSAQIDSTISKMRSTSSEGQANLRQCAPSQAQFRLHFTVQRPRRSMGRTAQCDVHSDTNWINVLQTNASNGFARRPNNSSEHPSPTRPWVCTEGTSNTGSRSATTSGFRCGSMSCPGHNKREWSDYSPDCVPRKDTIRANGETSTRHSTARWQQLPSPTRRCGTPDSITVIQSLSSWLRDTNAPTAKWTGSNQLLHRCCIRCASA